MLKMICSDLLREIFQYSGEEGSTSLPFVSQNMYNTTKEALEKNTGPIEGDPGQLFIHTRDRNTGAVIEKLRYFRYSEDILNKLLEMACRLRRDDIVRSLLKIPFNVYIRTAHMCNYDTRYIYIPEEDNYRLLSDFLEERLYGDTAELKIYTSDADSMLKELQKHTMYDPCDESRDIMFAIKFAARRGRRDIIDEIRCCI